mmetsp:Transcript_18622/g.23692  ORF Transcript_18622/g.23692 Transcript_18622/m.23692 type:complete len:179 (-) Transcript_18622:611-1147(-)
MTFYFRGIHRSAVYSYSLSSDSKSPSIRLYIPEWENMTNRFGDNSIRLTGKIVTKNPHKAIAEPIRNGTYGSPRLPRAANSWLNISGPITPDIPDTALKHPIANPYSPFPIRSVISEFTPMAERKTKHVGIVLRYTAQSGTKWRLAYTSMWTAFAICDIAIVEEYRTLHTSKIFTTIN